MATRRTKGVDTSTLPSAQDLIALSQRSNPADAVNAVTNGISSGFNLSQTLADRQLERQQKMAQIQQLIAKAKADAAQKANEQNLAATVAQTTPAATRPVSTLTFGGGQVPMAKQTRSFQQEQPARVEQAFSTAFPEKKAEQITEDAKREAEFANQKELQNIKFNQAKELQRMKNEGKSKGGKIPVSLINDQNLIMNQLKQIDEIENTLFPKNASGKRTSIAAGGSGLVKTLISKATLGNVGSPDLRLYDQNRPAIAVSVYRALTGDTRLSDADAKARALPLLPIGGEPAEVQSRKLAFIRAGMQRRQVVLKQVAEMAKNNELSPDDIQALTQIPLPNATGTSQETNEVDPSKFIEK